MGKLNNSTEPHGSWHEPFMVVKVGLKCATMLWASIFFILATDGLTIMSSHFVDWRRSYSHGKLQWACKWIETAPEGSSSWGWGIDFPKMDQCMLKASVNEKSWRRRRATTTESLQEKWLWVFDLCFEGGQEIGNYSLEHELGNSHLEHNEPCYGVVETVEESSEHACSKRGKLLQRLRRWVKGRREIRW